MSENCKIHYSRYAVGNVVYGLRISPHRYCKRCDVCGGSGRVRVAGHEDIDIYCPVRECSSGKVWLEMGQLYAIQRLTLGQLRLTAGHQPGVVYMAEETGVGSGSLWDEESLYPTYEAAEEFARSQGAVRQDELMQNV